jgi:hypothetical protein
VDLPPDFREQLEEFEREGVECVVVGGCAVAFTVGPAQRKISIS